MTGTSTEFVEERRKVEWKLHEGEERVRVFALKSREDRDEEGIT